MAAEETLTRAILEESNGRSLKNQLLLSVAAAREWPIPVGRAAMEYLFDTPAEPASAVAQFGAKLARFGPWCSGADYDELIADGLSERAIVAAVSAVALGHFRCTVAAGLLELPWASCVEEAAPGSVPAWKDTPGPYIAPRPATNESLDPPYSKLRSLFGFVPNVIQLQVELPRLVAAQADFIDAVLGPEDHLSQLQKHSLLLVFAAANRNTYLAALHTEILSLLGSTPDQVTLLLDDSERTPIASAVEMLLSRELRKLAIFPGNTKRPLDHDALRGAGVSQMQIMEGVVAAGLANFLCIVQCGLGAVPDFQPSRTFSVVDLYPSSDETRPTLKTAPLHDPDVELVTRVKAGDTGAFEDLMRRHTARVFRTLFGLLGNHEEARDATQDTFLKVFEHINKFEARSKFSTWLTSIAVNTGTELLRRRRPTESLDESDDETGFRPRQIQSWVDNPEQSLAKSQMDDLVRKSVLRLPEKYRVALLLRDINQLSTEDTAAALGLSVPATKARILRGRLMLRETLTPYLVKVGGDSNV